MREDGGGLGDPLDGVCRGEEREKATQNHAVEAHRVEVVLSQKEKVLDLRVKADH